MKSKYRTRILRKNEWYFVEYQNTKSIFDRLFNVWTREPYAHTNLDSARNAAEALLVELEPNIEYYYD